MGPTAHKAPRSMLTELLSIHVPLAQSRFISTKLPKNLAARAMNSWMGYRRILVVGGLIRKMLKGGKPVLTFGMGLNPDGGGRRPRARSRLR